ncbi:uncharacterized protein LOC143225069 isoform X2 [Tachypleus tridentatus]|uniref:uncharacterized protein LOC143225069 isoform X2 n=1 Tax=Tachypleus tridentatus TaxID=6853 RepID=UPI003FD528D9
MNWLTSISLPCSSVSYLVGTSRNPALLILYGSKNSSNSNSCSRLNKYHNSKLTALCLKTSHMMTRILNFQCLILAGLPNTVSIRFVSPSVSPVS